MNVVLSWLCSNSAVTDRLTARWATDVDHQAAARRPTGPARNTSLLARAALRALLAEETGRADWRLIADPRGKPLAVDPADQPGPAVSLSHGGGLVAVALSSAETRLGVDVEAHRKRDVQALAGYAFGPTEQALVRAGGAGAFFRIWSLREAMGKATGDGLALAVDRRDRVAGGDEYGIWSCGEWWLAHLAPQQGYSLAVALLGGGRHRLTLRPVSLKAG